MELHNTLKLKTPLGEAVSSVDSACRFLNEVTRREAPALEKRLAACQKEGSDLADEMPMHSATIRMGLGQAEERWRTLLELLEEREAAARAARGYFEIMERAERFVREANRLVIGWSRRISEDPRDTARLKGEIETFIKANKKQEEEACLRMSSAATKAFGHSGYEKTQAVQREQSEAFESMQNLLRDIEGMDKKRRSLHEEEEEAERKRRSQVEAEANLRAARAEAEVAKVAARKAEEARRAAEEATVRAKAAAKPPQRPSTPREETATPTKQVAPLFTELLKDLVLRDGQRCRLAARVNGAPTPQITWFKDGVPVKPDNTDYKTFIHPDGLCTLDIAETFVEDSANWSVRAFNPAGYAESHAKLTVQEAARAVEEQARPLVLVPLADLTAREGDAVELRCQVSGKPDPQVSWFRDGVCLDRAENVTLGVGAGGQLVLRLRKVTADDDGARFVLKAANPLGSVETAGRLAVIAEKKADRPKEEGKKKRCQPAFYIPLRNLEATEGQEVTMECMVTASPTAEITWYRNNIPLTQKEGAVMTNKEGTFKLTFKDVKEEQAGEWLVRRTCI